MSKRASSAAGEIKDKHWYEGEVCTRYAGDLKGLLSLFSGSGMTEKGCARQVGEREGSVQALGVCPLYGAFDVFTQIKDAVPVIHGPIGCCHLQLGFHIRMVYGSSRPPDRAFPIAVSSNMQENDIVMGGTEKLQEAILTADRELRPRLIVVLGACAPAIIGDYIPQIIDEVRGKVAAEILWLEGQGISGRAPFTGFQDAYRTLIDQLVEPPTERLPDHVNILGEKSTEAGGEVNLGVMKRYLDRFGLKILTRFVRSTTVEGIRGMARARLNLIRCHEPGWRPARHLKEKFGMDYLEDDFPFGFRETERWLRNLGELLDQRPLAERLIEEERGKFGKRIEEAKGRLQGKTVILCGNGGRAVSLLKFCAELGMEVLQLHFWGPIHDRPLQDLRDYLEETGHNLEVRSSPDFYEQEALVKALKPHLFLGDPSHTHLCLEKGVSFDNIHQSPQVGYPGALNLAERWIDAIERPVYDGWLYRGVPLHSSQQYISQCMRDANFCGRKQDR
ncbi:MAG: nitrogenase component 1 [Candidatus Tectomicrobia bacterium]|uniref:Nitrogenase component 1 n=1 Tax=Tectimicrobiota bacterium TaxID=2528274 RepID=A0A932CNB3_UNCTE|nr:nitrogenase component 1 [Candidatus Tectomicrobia bacterium]